MIDILQQQIEDLQDKKRVIEEARFKVQETFHTKMTERFTEYFKHVLPEGISLKVQPGDKYEKEIFTLSLRQDWFNRDEEKRYYTSVQGINYYTCGTTKSEFELTRLMALGKVAEVLLKSEVEILEIANELGEEYRTLLQVGNYSQRSWDIDKVIQGLKTSISNIEKEERKKMLLSTGINFSKAVKLQLKFNFSPNIRFIKVIDLGRSGKKVKVSYIYHSDTTERTFEEVNVSMENLLSQIDYYRSSIIQPETVE